MNLSFSQPPRLEWTTGDLSGGPLLRKSTCIQDLTGIFSDERARQSLAGEHIVYEVEMLNTSPAEGELYTGITHLYPGRVGHEYFMTRGHFHAHREQGEVYFGLRGAGLLLLQNEQGEVRLEKVFTGSVHVIAGYTAHRLINTGDEVLSALAVWPTLAGHDYQALAKGFNVRVFEENQQPLARTVQNG